MNSTILIVDDDPGTIQATGRALASLATLCFATNGEDALRIAVESLPDLILLDAQMPGMSGFMVFDVLRASPQLSAIPVVFISSHYEPAFEVSALDLGAVDFLPKPVNPRQLLARVRSHLRIKHLVDELRRTSVTDLLTGVTNRRQFDESLAIEWRKARRGGEPLSLLLVDVDHFRSFNECYGHSKGDACLQMIAQSMQSALRRPEDTVARCGGAEFGVLLPKTARQGAQHMADRISMSVGALNIPHTSSPTAPRITVSLGIAVYDKESKIFVSSAGSAGFRHDTHAPCTENDMVLAADKALNAAKRAGRAQARMLDVADIDQPIRAGKVAVRRIADTGRLSA